MGRLSTTECTYLPTYLPTLSNSRRIGTCITIVLAWHW